MNEQEIVQEAVKKPNAMMRDLVTGSLYYFIQYFWSCYQEAEKFEGNWHIEVQCQELEEIARLVAANEPKKYDLISNVPPGTTKTALYSIFFPIWCWVQWYWFRFITTSHSDALSLESAEYSRDVIRSEKFRSMFPEIQIKQDKDTKSNFRIIKYEEKNGRTIVRQGGGRISTSVGAKIIGFHAHIIIGDDLIDPKGAISAAKLAEAIHYVDQTLPTRKVNKLVTPFILIMQRLAQNDPTGHLLEQRHNIKNICLPGEIHNYEHSVKPEEFKKYYVDGLLDPKRLGWKALKNLETELGQYGYSGQVGQDPIPFGGGMFKVDMINIIDTVPGNVNKWCRYWDKAGTKKRKELEKLGKGGAAYTVGCKMGRTDDGKYIIVDIKRGQWASEEREKVIRAAAEADGKKVKQMVEQEPGSGGKESAEGTMRNLAGFRADAHNPTGSKEERADPFSVQVNWGNVYLLRGEWNAAYKKELEHFPYSTYKDQVDASSGAFAYLTGRIKKKTNVPMR